MPRRLGVRLTTGAIALMLMLCLTWGFNQIAIKLVMQDIPPFLHASIRSCGALILGIAAWISGETVSRVPGQLTLILMAWQAIGVVGLTFLLRFGLVRTCSASKLSAFTFITPLFGVAAGYFIMHAP